jgi:hypothetical protein
MATKKPTKSIRRLKKSKKLEATKPLTIILKAGGGQENPTES